MAEPFKKLADLCEQLEKTRSRNEKIKLVTEYFKRFCKQDTLDAEAAAYLLVGFSTGVRRLGLNVGPSTLYKALKEKHEPLTAFDELTVQEVWDTLQRVKKLSGAGSASLRTALLSGLFSRAGELEKKWLVRMISGEMRHGFNVGLLLEALAQLTGKPSEVIRTADILLGNLGELVKKSIEGSVETVTLTLFKPVKPMLAEYVYSAGEPFEILGTPLYCEPKIDGVRVQIQKKGNVVKVFSRGLRELTSTMPDLVEKAVQNVAAEEVILDGEAYSVDKDGKPLPFQETMRRVGREKDVDKALSDHLLEIKFFDILYLNGESLLNKPFRLRREALERCVSKELLNEAVEVGNQEELERCFKRWVGEGFEGIMVKSPEAPYVPGRRGKYWLKMKHTESLDVVVIAAEWGHGRRRGWLSNYHLAVIDDRTGEYVPVGKTFKGLTDQEFKQMTEALLKLKREETEWGITVEPKIVLEVEYNEVQKSPHYVSGYALRFARVKRIRDDKSPSEVDTLSKLEKIYIKQRRGIYPPTAG